MSALRHADLQCQGMVVTPAQTCAAAEVGGGGTLHCPVTVGHEGVIDDLSSESISAHYQGLQTPVQLAVTTRSAQIWISG